MVEYIIRDAFGLVKHRFLFEEDHVHIFIDPYLAFVGGFLAFKDAEQGGFAGTVPGYQGYLIAFFYIE
jgi:hypothetical protein